MRPVAAEAQWEAEAEREAEAEWESMVAAEAREAVREAVANEVGCGGRVPRVGGGGGGCSRGGHRDAGRPSCKWPVGGLRPGQALNGLLCLCV